MPKSKEYISSSESDSDSDGKPKEKKAKKEKKPEKKPKSSGSGGKEEMMELGKMKYVSVSEFKGRKFVNIREYYNDANGDLKPGKKGIALDKGMWERLKSHMDEIDEQI